jgi:rRNA processing protein Krr1/Pno1
MKTITIDLLNNKALKLLQDLELLDIIRLHKTDENQTKSNIERWDIRFKGAMSKQSINTIDDEQKKLRDEWE